MLTRHKKERGERRIGGLDVGSKSRCCRLRVNLAGEMDGIVSSCFTYLARLLRMFARSRIGDIGFFGCISVVELGGSVPGLMIMFYVRCIRWT